MKSLRKRFPEKPIQNVQEIISVTFENPIRKISSTHFHFDTSNPDNCTLYIYICILDIIEKQVIAKSTLIIDVKPWDDTIGMFRSRIVNWNGEFFKNLLFWKPSLYKFIDVKKLEEHTRKIEADGLLWGSSKLKERNLNFLLLLRNPFLIRKKYS